MDATRPRPHARQAFSLVLLLSLVPVVWAVMQLGRVHPDETYQYLEPAFYRVRGYGVLAWEWRVGLRNWAVPQVLAAFLRLADALGLEDPRAYRALVEVPVWALHVAALGATLRMARRRVSERQAWVALTLVALSGSVVAMAGRTMGETFSAAFLLLAVDALERAEERWTFGTLAGLYLGMAVVVRYGSGVFVLAAIGWLAARRAWRALGATIASGALVAAMLGVLDRLTWGRYFHSFVTYANFNVLSHHAAERFGASPWYYYLPYLAGFVPVWFYFGQWKRARHERLRLTLPLVMALVYVVVVSWTPHKEKRFLYPALVLLLVDAAPGVAAALAGIRRRALKWACGAVALGVGAVPYGFLHAQSGDQFRATVAAVRASEVTGLLEVGEGLWDVGGYFYLGKDIPWVACRETSDPAFAAAIRNPRINRAATFNSKGLEALRRAGFRVIEQRGRATVLAR